MSKRYADTAKYSKAFIRSLPAAYKLLWDYICLTCNHAGIWFVDFEVAQICIGKDAQVDLQTALDLFNKDEVRIKVLNGSRWCIIPFVDFQYGTLNPDNRVHASVIDELKKVGIDVMVKQIKREPLKVKHLDTVYLTVEEYNHLKEKLGVKLDEWIRKLNDYINMKGVKYKSHYHTILNWVRRDEPKPEKHIQRL